MAMLLLANKAPSRAHILVLGAGGGLELKAFADARPEWELVGVDPSAEMLGLARSVVGPSPRILLEKGYVEDAPAGPFDGAACLLTLHFLEGEERLRTLRELRRRMRSGAPLVVAHHSITGGVRGMRWLTMSGAFGNRANVDFFRAAEAAATMAKHLPVMCPEQDELLLQEAGFGQVELFYAAFSLRGWVATA